MDGPLDPSPRHRYQIGLDLGLKRDRTVLTVCHTEPSPDLGGLPRVVLDRIHVLAGTPSNPVQLSTVEAVARQAADAYGAKIRLDPWQAIGLAQRLRSSGLRVEEWSFTPASVGHLAMTLHLLLREHRLALPDDPGLLDELANVRLRETTPGVLRLDHDSGHHDDRAVALGLAALALTERPAGHTAISMPAGTISRSTSLLTSATLRTPTPGSKEALLALRRAARKGPRLPGGAIVGVPGDHYSRRRDDPRERRNR